MHLKLQLDALIKNVVNDWDFTIIISGSGEVRVGKSTLAAQIATYWTYEMWRVHKRKTLLRPSLEQATLFFLYVIPFTEDTSSPLLRLLIS